MQCQIPPQGWYCTRQAGHDGPCAAVPEPLYEIVAKQDGTWLHLNGERFKACIRLESLIESGIGAQALEQVRAALSRTGDGLITGVKEFTQEQTDGS
jgi:hypothetical protein